MSYGTALFLAAVLSLTSGSASAAIYNFDNIAPGTAIPLSITNAGINATFSSPDGGVFTVGTSFFTTLTGNILLDADGPAHELDVTFSQNISSISLNFALNGAPGSTFTLRAHSGGLAGPQVGMVTTAAVLMGAAFPENLASFSGPVFNAIRLTSNVGDFAIDNVNTSPTPEPGSLGFLLMASVVGALKLRRLRHRIND